MNPRLVKAHRILAVGLAAFLILHFGIHLTAIGGAEVHLRTLKSLQGIYRNPVIEPLLIVAILLQISLGVKLLMGRLREPHKGFWGWTQIFSGFYLAFFFLLHTSAALGTRYLAGLDTNFHWAAGTLNIDRLPFLFAPYYFLGVLSVFAHLSSAIYFARGGRGSKLPIAIIAVGAAVALTIVLTFNGAFYDIQIPAEYVEYFQKYLPK